VRLIAAFVALLHLPDRAQALDPARTMAQFHHTQWTMQDGMPASINAIAQSSDGFLWLGTTAGLHRFDGVRTEAVSVGKLPSPAITALVTNGDDLWIGLHGQIARVRRGELTTFTLPPTTLPAVLYLVADQGAGVWVGTRNDVMHFDGRRWRKVAGPWPPGATFSAPGGVWGLALARDGTLWAKNLLGLYYLRQGGTAFEQAPGYAGGLIDFARHPDGRLWTADFGSKRFYALPDLQAGRPVPPPIFGASVPPSILAKVMMDRDGTLWNVNRITGGLYRLPSVIKPAVAERYTVAPGSTPLDFVSSVIEDREGAIWVSSMLGLDRFRPANIVVENNLRVRPQAPVMVATSDAVFVYTGMGAPVPDPADAGRRLYRIPRGGGAELVAPNLGQLQAMAATPEGDLIMASEGKLTKWRRGVVTPIAVPAEVAGTHVRNLATAPNGGLLVSYYGKGVYRRSAGQWSRISPPSALPGDAPKVAVDAAGAAWLFYPELVVRADGQGITEFPETLSASLGEVRGTLSHPDGLIVVGEAGAVWFRGRTPHLLPASRAPVLTLAFGIVQTPDRDIWIGTQVGLVRVAETALLRAFTDVDAPLQYKLFDVADGFRSAGPYDGFNDTLTMGPDGRVWFIGPDHVAWIDPKRLYRNLQPPPVVIRSATANGRRYERLLALTLPAGTSQLQIDYTALSLAAPERVRFRYKLDGVDENWVDAAGRRQAFYTNLQPGNYRFRVLAANGDGVWNNEGATLSFKLQPTFWQTWIFKLLVLAVGVAILWMLYRLRLLQISERIRARLVERMDERERIARELHDTLLQGVHGLTLKLQSFAEQMPPERPERRLLEQALDRADEVLAEGRDRVRDLRARQSLADLPEKLAAVVDRLRDDGYLNCRINVDGQRRAVFPEVIEEVASVAGEALFNACMHARATQIIAEVTYGRHQLVVSICDDGIGIDGDTLERGREGHFGLPGMRERAARIRGHLTVFSVPGGGTKVTLVVPGRQAYVRRPEHAAIVFSGLQIPALR
jgi:signal transduction histidine kinase